MQVHSVHASIIDPHLDLQHALLHRLLALRMVRRDELRGSNMEAHRHSHIHMTLSSPSIALM